MPRDTLANSATGLLVCQAILTGRARFQTLKAVKLQLWPTMQILDRKTALTKRCNHVHKCDHKRLVVKQAKKIKQKGHKIVKGQTFNGASRGSFLESILQF